MRCRLNCTEKSRNWACRSWCGSTIGRDMLQCWMSSTRHCGSEVERCMTGRERVSVGDMWGILLGQRPGGAVGTRRMLVFMFRLFVQIWLLVAQMKIEAAWRWL